MSKHISSLAPGGLAETANVKVSVQPMIGRLALRVRQDLAKVDRTLGFVLPRKIGDCAKAAEIEAVCLGPDEWTLIMPLEKLSGVKQALAAIYADVPHSVTEVSGREVTIAIEGAQAATLLTLACPRDIATIQVGQARRTVFDGATVVIWCDAPDAYRMDVWNSFAPFVAQTLETGTYELAAEVD